MNPLTLVFSGQLISAMVSLSGFFAGKFFRLFLP
jgi:hypothetical protein